MSYKYNFAMIISDSQQKYVVLKAMRRSNGITKKDFNEKIEIKSVRFVSNKSLVLYKCHG